MGTLRSLLVLGIGAVIGGAALIAYRISQETGKPFQEALAEVPEEARRILADVKIRAGEAVERGRKMYEEQQRAFMQDSQEASAQ
jgi:hypothetical protein